MAALSNKCEAIFAELHKIRQQLQTSTHGTDLFDIENGIDHFIGNGIGDQITEAVRDFVTNFSEVDNQAHKVGKIDRVLRRCGYSVRECKKYLDEAVRAPDNNEELEEKVSAAWRNFAFSTTHLSLLIPMKRVEVLELMGNSGAEVRTLETPYHKIVPNGTSPLRMHFPILFPKLGLPVTATASCEIIQSYQQFNTRQVQCRDSPSYILWIELEGEVKIQPLQPMQGRRPIHEHVQTLARGS